MIFLSNLAFLLLSYFSIFLIFDPCICSLDIRKISLNTLQTYTFWSQQPVLFQIPGDFSLQMGWYDVLVTPAEESQNFSHLIINHQNCNNQLDSTALPYDQTFSFNDPSGISFDGEGAEDHCFKVELLDKVNANYSILVKFSQIDYSFKLNKALSFETSEDSRKMFSCAFDNHSVEIILITLKSIIPGNFTRKSALEIINNQGICLQNENQETASSSWLCHLGSLKDLLIFSANDYGGSGSYQITLSEIKPQKVNANTESDVSSFIPGFGNLFFVNVADIGVLKFQVKHEDYSISQIIASNSIHNLFGVLSQRCKICSHKAEESIIIQNQKIDTNWYYFVPENESKQFSIKCNFIEEKTLNLDTEDLFYIDPEIYEYQNIRLNLGKIDLLERYEAVLSTLEPNSSMNLYYATAFHDGLFQSIKNQNNFLQQTFLKPSSEQQISLSFIVGSYDSTPYLIIQASKKGYYRLKINKVSPISSLGTIFTLTFTFYLLAYLSSCIVKIYRLSKANPNDLTTFETITVSRNDEHEVPGLEMNTRQLQNIPEENQSSSSNIANLKVILEKLHIQTEIKQKNEKEEKEQNRQNSTVIQPSYLNTPDEEEKCDVCYVNQKIIVFLPCNHLCTCAFCASVIVQTSLRCPLCRANILEVGINNFEEN